MGMAAAWWHGAKTSDKALVRHQQEGTASNGQHEGKGLSRGKTQAPLRTPKGQRAGQEARAAARPPRCAESAASAPQGRKGLWQSHGYRGPHHVRKMATRVRHTCLGANVSKQSTASSARLLDSASPANLGNSGRRGKLRYWSRL